MTRQLTILTVYAAAMALLESAVVVYMRRLYYPNDPLQLFPLQFLATYDPLLELAREAATIVMIVTVALLAESTSLTRRFAAFVFVFGVWDLFYYFWLKVLMGWPVSWLEWDVLFLIPGVWLGPWVCPALISLLFIVWGTWTLRSGRRISFASHSLIVFLSGAAIGVATFLQPAVAVWWEADAELRHYTPTGFCWWLFLASYLMMAFGLGMTLRGAKLDQP